MKEMLSRFCSPDATRFNITTPWSAGAHSYATDGHILIRIQRLGDVPERDDAPNVVGMFDIEKPENSYRLADIVLPESEVNKKQCPDCSGQGTEEHECPECDGDGKLDFNTPYHDYEVDCSMCEGEGKIHKCETCNATGEIVVENLQPIKIGGSHYQLRFLLLMKDLLGCKIWPNADPMGVAAFTFDGGDGLIMPVRVT